MHVRVRSTELEKTEDSGPHRNSSDMRTGGQRTATYGMTIQNGSNVAKEWKGQLSRNFQKLRCAESKGVHHTGYVELLDEPNSVNHTFRIK